MADTLPIIKLSSTAYTNINTTSGIGVGTPLSLQNQSDLAFVRMVVSSTQPAADSEDYILVYPDPRFPGRVSAGNNTVWAMSVRFNDVPVGVQEID